MAAIASYAAVAAVPKDAATAALAAAAAAAAVAAAGRRRAASKKVTAAVVAGSETISLPALPRKRSCQHHQPKGELGGQDRGGVVKEESGAIS
jgi:hypothetical protein